MTEEIKEKKEDTTYVRFTKMLDLAVRMFGRGLTKDEIGRVLKCSKRTTDRVVNCFHDVYYNGLEESWDVSGKKGGVFAGTKSFRKY